MDLGLALLEVGAGERPEHFARFTAAIDPAWVEAALTATGTATVRRRRLPAEQVVWLVIGMGMFRDRSIAEVVEHLALVLPTPSRRAVTSGAVVQARDRLGAAPLACLFEQLAACWATASADAQRWRGLALYGIDGSTLRIADTPDNEAEFGRPGSARGQAGYPQVRAVALLVLRSHLLAGLALGAWNEGETTLAHALLHKIPERSLTIFDRGFLSYDLLYGLQNGGAQRNWLIRAKSNLTWRVLERRGRNDHLVEITMPRALRAQNPDLPSTFLARAIRYKQPGFRAQTLLTSLLDPEAYPAAEVAQLYHERWELELAFDEIKTHTLEREEALRSRSPERVYQEIWGLAIAYNLVRWHMQRVARALDLPPVRISYRHTLMLLRGFWLTIWAASPGVVPRRLEELDLQSALLILPPRRTRRRYPRAVKVKMSGYRRKR
jgi:hypothetical protein